MAFGAATHLMRRWLTLGGVDQGKTKQEIHASTTVAEQCRAQGQTAMEKLMEKQTTFDVRPLPRARRPACRARCLTAPRADCGEHAADCAEGAQGGGC